MRRLLVLLLTAWTGSFWAGRNGAHAEPTVSLVRLPFRAEEFRGPGSRVVAVVPSTDRLREDRSWRDRPIVVAWGPGGSAVLTLQGDTVASVPLGPGSDIAALERTPNAIPSSRLAAAGPISAFLSEPNSSYPHAALGSAVHAGAITIVERQAPQTGGGVQRIQTITTRVEAGPGAVFEDRALRFADLDGDGAPEIVTVKSYFDRGSALAVIGKREGTWRVLAETPPIGAAQRWLDPAAIADFDGSGRPQIALVQTPHRDGMLQVWGYADGRLTKLREAAGYADHANGQTAVDLAATVMRDGRPFLAIPTLDRASLALVDLRGGIKELWRVALPARAATGVAALGRDADARILVGLDDGQVAVIRP